MHKVFALLSCIVYLIVISPTAICKSSSEDSNDIAWLMQLYGYTLTDDILNTMHLSFVPQEFDCGDIKVVLSEILYDGIWIYTAAQVTPTNPDNILVMPASADMSDFVCGGYLENLRDDSRSFIEAAEQDGKDIICVSLYPSEFDGVPFYFLDHRQDAGDQSTLFSGAPGEWKNETLSLHIRVVLLYIPITSQGDLQQVIYEFPVEVSRTGEVYSQSYQSLSNDSLPFTTLTLTKTELNVYVYPEWSSDYAKNTYEYILLDRNGMPLTSGIPSDNSTYIMSTLPDQIAISLHNTTVDEEEAISVTFQKVDNN